MVPESREEVLRKEIGKLFKKQYNESGVNKLEVAQSYSRFAGVSLATARTHISEYCTGYLHITSREGRPERHTKTRLTRFSFLCYFLGVEEDSELARLTKELNPDFIYPSDHARVFEEASRLSCLLASLE